MSACLGLPIGCMKFLLPNEFVTIFSLGKYPFQRTPYLLCSPKSEYSKVSHKLLLALMYSFPMHFWLSKKRCSLFSMCSQHVFIMFLWDSPSSQVIPEGVPNSTWILSRMVCPKFNSHIHNLPLGNAQWCRKFADGSMNMALSTREKIKQVLSTPMN